MCYTHLKNELLAMIYCNDNYELKRKQHIQEKGFSKTLYTLLWLKGRARHS